jgi:hypothetical protein
MRVLHQIRSLASWAVMAFSVSAALPGSRASAQGSAAASPRPTPVWLVSVDWLQAGALAVDRSTVPSATIAIQRRSSALAAEFGYLRAVRSLSTVQGGYAAVGRVMQLGSSYATLGLGLFVGQAQASADTSGYHFTANGQTGYQSRFTYSSAVAVGAGVHATLGIPFGSNTELRATISEWGFNGEPLTGNNARLLAGAGLMFRLPRGLWGGKSSGGAN